MATLKSIKNKYLSSSDGAVLGVAGNTENISALSFKVATADSLTKFNMVDGFSDDYNDSTGVDAVASSNDARNAAGKYYRGEVAGSVSGGTESTYSSGGTTYRVHKFTSGGNFFGWDWVIGRSEEVVKIDFFFPSHAYVSNRNVIIF